MRMRVIMILSVIVLAGKVSASRAADFAPPANGKLTQTQVVNYIAVLQDQTNFTKLPADHAGKKRFDTISDHGFSRAEFDWVGNQMSNCWPTAVLQQKWEETVKPNLERQIKAGQDDEQAAKNKLAIHKLAMEDGKPVVTSPPTTNPDSPAEVKTDQDAIKPLEDEIAQHDKDAADAEALANTPPTGIAAADRSAFIDQKKNDAQTAHDAAKDARDRLTEVQKSLDDAKANVTAPALETDEETDRIDAENDPAIRAANRSISNDERAIASLQNMLEAGPVNLLEDQKNMPDPDNLALVQKHLKEYLAAIGAADDNAK